MKHHYTINERGELIAGDGACLGRITEIKLTLEDSPDHAAEVEVEELTLDDFPAPLTRAPGPPKGGTTSTATSEPTSTATSKSKSKSKDSAENSIAVEATWAYWIEKRNPRRTTLEPSQAKMIAKGLELVGEDGMRAAIDGLLASEWHRDHGQLRLSAILATKPGGPTLGDQLDGFIEKSPAIEKETRRIAVENGRLRGLRHELSRYEQLSEDELRFGDKIRMDEIRAQIAELGLL
jgi:hypothetical protein